MQEISSNTFTPPYPLNTAVLFLVFNRPDTTKQIFAAIRKAKASRLYVTAGGPRTDKAGEQEKCEQVRKIAIQDAPGLRSGTGMTTTFSIQHSK